MKVTLRKRHIKKGQTGESQYCPIALALKEKTHKSVDVGDAESITINGTSYFVKGVQLKNRVDNFIQNFDAGLMGWVKPFTFEVLPAQC